MATDEKFTGVQHKHNPVALALKTRQQALRMTALLDMLDEYSAQADCFGTVMIAMTPQGARIILCKGCLEIARQNMLDTIGILDDLIKHPVEDI